MDITRLKSYTKNPLTSMPNDGRVFLLTDSFEYDDNESGEGKLIIIMAVLLGAAALVVICGVVLALKKKN